MSHQPLKKNSEKKANLGNIDSIDEDVSQEDENNFEQPNLKSVAGDEYLQDLNKFSYNHLKGISRPATSQDNSKYNKKITINKDKSEMLAKTQNLLKEIEKTSDQNQQLLRIIDLSKTHKDSYKLKDNPAKEKLIIQ
jgi:hypothetical protein